MKVDLKFPLLNLDGSQVNMPDGSPAIANVVLANWIMNSPSKASDIVKRYVMATDLYKNGFLEFEEPDRIYLYELIQNMEGVSLLVRGLILEKLHSC